MSLSTHILDQGAGRPAAGVEVLLSKLTQNGLIHLGTGRTDEDGRISDFGLDEPLSAGAYQLDFDTGTYFHDRGEASFYPYVPIVFEVANASEHYHVPLLLNRFGYSTYRGS